MIKRPHRLMLLQVSACLAFLTLPIWLSTSPAGGIPDLLAAPTIRDFIANALMISFFYLNYFLLIPAIYFRKLYVSYALIIIATMFIIAYLPSFLTGRNPFLAIHPGLATPAPPGTQGVPPQRSDYYNEIKHLIFLFISVVIFSILLRVRSRLFQAEAARHQAELDILLAQINPHFLFNTLNSIYSLVVMKDDQAADALLNLSDLMRYIIKDARGNVILLQKELDYIENYIDLQRARLGNTVDIQFMVHGTPASQQEIVPLILISFIENAFKYGVNPDKESRISISIHKEERRLSLEVFNIKVFDGREIISSGIGLTNTKERLKYLYPGKHVLDITENTDTYQVNLQMELL